MTTRRVSLAVDGVVLDQWSKVQISRDLGDLAGGFYLEVRDSIRNIKALPWATSSDGPGPIRPGQPCTISIDGEPVLVGFIDQVQPRADAQASLTVSGRDRTQDLVDCPSNPKGKHQYRNITLLEGAKRTAQPFGIKVRAEVDTGKPFDRWTIETGETALSTIEKYARRRAILVTSDGVGGLVLTRSGQRRAGGALIFPGNMTASAGAFTWTQRFSDYFVKGQSVGGGGKRAAAPGLDVRQPPVTTRPAPTGDQSGEGHAEAGSHVMGLVRDPEVDRWRPFVAPARTETTEADAKTQAEWLMRTHRAKSERLDPPVRDWRTEAGHLWRINELVQVSDRFQGVHRDMLIAGAHYFYDEKGPWTRLRLVGPEAYDLLPEGERRKNRPASGGDESPRVLEATAAEL